MRSDDYSRGFDEGYALALKEYEQGYADGFVAGYYSEDEDDGIERSRAYQLGFAHGFVAGNNYYVTSSEPIDDSVSNNLWEDT